MNSKITSGRGAGGLFSPLPIRANALALLILVLACCPSLLAQEQTSPAKQESPAPVAPDTKAKSDQDTNAPASQEQNAPADEDTNAPALSETNTLAKQLTNALGPLEKSPAALPQTNMSARLDYTSFRLVNDRNIFNANRTPRMSRNGRSGGPQPKPVKVDSFSLVGTMSSEKGKLAFFNSSNAQYKKVIRPEETIAGYTVKDITDKFVNLEAGGKVTELRVGMQMRRQDEGDWKAVAQTAAYANVKSSSTAPGKSTETNSSAASSGSADEDEVLKKLMQKREQELNK